MIESVKPHLLMTPEGNLPHSVDETLVQIPGYVVPRQFTTLTLKIAVGF